MPPKRSTSQGTLTFVFTDLVGSTEISTTRGDRVAHELVRAYTRIVRQRAGRHHGKVVREQGDGLLLAFTSTLDAVACAQEVQRALRQFNCLHPHRSISVRVGIHCGEAIRDRGDFVGAAVNAAARICSCAGGGQVLVSGLVKEMLESVVEWSFMEAGEHVFKGFPRPWRLYEVDPEKGMTAAAKLGRALAEEMPFVGREVELRTAHDVLSAAARGDGSLYLIAGEAGVGKSRLAAEIVDFATSQRFQVVIGRCYEVGGPPAYGPFNEALRILVRRLPRRSLEKMLADDGPWLARLVLELQKKLPDLPAAPVLPPDQERHLSLNAASGFLLRAARRKPLLLLLEDLHWADRATLTLLRHLARAAEREPIAILGTYRDVEVEPGYPFAEALTELYRLRRFFQARLDRFSREQLKRMLLGLSESEPPAGVVEAIHEQTEGNPLFVEYFLKLVIDDDRLFDAEGEWRKSPRLQDLDVPEGATLLIDRQLQRLSAEHRRVLSAAAVVGREFRDDVLEQATDLTGEGIAEAVAEAERMHLLHPVAQGRRPLYSFRHELVWRTLYQEIPTSIRRQIHGRVAVAMERVHAATVSEHASDLAYHFREAGNTDKLRLYVPLAGDRAMAASAFEEALDYYLEARELGTVDDRGAALLWFKLGAAQQSTGRVDEAVSSWRRAIDLYEKTGDAGHVEEVSYYLTLLLGWRGRFSEMIPAMHRGLNAAPASGSEARCRLRAAAGKWLVFGSQPTAAERSIEEALSIARARGDDALLGTVLATRGGNEWIYTRFAEAKETITHAAELLRRAGDLAGLLLCCADLLVTLGYLGQLDEIDAGLAELESLAQKLGDPGGASIHALFHGVIAYARGDLGGARRWGVAAQDLARAGAFVVLPQALQLRAEVALASGDCAAAEQLYIEAAQLNTEMGRPPARYIGSMSILLLRALCGDTEGATAMLAELPSPPSSGQLVSCHDYDGMVTASMGLVMLGHAERAAVYYPTLAALAERGAVFASASFPLLQRVLGMIAASNGWSDRACAHYETALQTASAMEAKRERAETAYWYGRMLLEGGGDGAESRALLAEAVSGYARIGMPVHEQKAHALCGD